MMDAEAEEGEEEDHVGEDDEEDKAFKDKQRAEAAALAKAREKGT